MDDKKAKHLLDLFLKNPGSMVSWALIVGAAAITYSNLANASRDQDRKIDKIELKIAADNIEDATRTQRLAEKITDMDGRLKGIETDIKWLVRTARPFSLTDPPRNP